MKELSIEQKSKRYDEAIHRAKLALDCCDSASQITKNVVYDIFPELKENEGEGIRKEIISALKYANHKGVYDKHIAWLERQCEQKQAHKYEPMFKVGDWVVTDKNGVVQIKAIKNDNYVLENASKFSVYYVDKCWKKWGISDAKDGDVLYSLDSNQPFIYKERNIYEQATAYCGINKYGKFFVWNAKDCIITLDKYIPATKEQRDALMKAMADAGYEWNAEKKELKRKVETRFHEGDWVVDMLGEAWKIERVLNYFYILKDVEGDETQPTIEWVNKTFHLWTIEDAKDGDILASKFNKPFIYDGKHTSRNVGAHCGITTSDKLIISSEECHWTDNFNIHPANKDQRDILMKAMNDEGYVFDFNKKELIHEYVYSN